MPEGPEIRRAADRLADAIVGSPLTLAWFAFPNLKRHERGLKGRRIEAIVPHGKALLTRFDHGWTMYSHNQLYGVWRIAAAGERPETDRSLRVALETADRAILLYPFLVKLGPDVLDTALDAAQVAERLRAPAFHGRRLGALLLDQGFLAGMGNYLRSEVLFLARLSPDRRPRDLTDAQRRVLAEALLDVPRRSYATRGIEPAAGMRADYLTDTPHGFRFAVFDREGQPCPICQAAIERREVGARRLYLCRRCQS
jgi:endonuclease VIII